jgi:SpoVK/Ycf46/Vps4 family AAA+-type ATPase
VQIIASETDSNIALFSGNSAKMHDNELFAAFESVPENCILLVEDVDSFFSLGDSTSTNHDQGHSSFMAFLQVTDGLACNHGGLKIFTTNHANRINPTLLARFHRIETFAHADIERTRNIIKTFLEIDENEHENKLLDIVVSELFLNDRNVCVRILQSHLMQWYIDNVSLQDIVNNKNKILTKLRNALAEEHDLQSKSDNYIS